MELYNYCVNMPDIPSVDMSFSESNVKAYVEGNSQRTSVITFKADKLQTITFKLPSGVKLVNVTTGKTSAAGASVEISGGTQFYLTAPLDQAESVSATFSSQMKGSIDKEYSAYKIVTGSGTQDLALVFGEGVGNEKYVDFKVTWTKECKVSIVKKDQDTGNALAGAVYGIYSDAAYTKLIAEMPATDQNGASQLTMEKTQEVVYLKEISVPTGYQIDTKSYNVTLAIGKTTTKNVTDKRVNAKINIAKQDAETGNEAQNQKAEKGRNRSQESRHSCGGHCKGRVRPCQQFTAERADERSTNSMNITYTQNGDYLIPNIIIRKTKPLGHYGRLRKAYLEMHRPILFNELVLSDKLFEHCAEIDETARNRMELIVRSLAEQNGVTEQLKAENQMEWVRQMNACKAQAEEIVKVELIYD